MAKVSVPQTDGEIVVSEGGERTVYKVKDGVIVVSEPHVAAVLASVSGSELKPENPAKEAS